MARGRCRRAPAALGEDLGWSRCSGGGKGGGVRGGVERACGYVDNSFPPLALPFALGCPRTPCRPPTVPVRYATSCSCSSTPSRYASAGVRPPSAECGSERRAHQPCDGGLGRPQALGQPLSVSVSPPCERAPTLRSALSVRWFRVSIYRSSLLTGCSRYPSATSSLSRTAPTGDNAACRRENGCRRRARTACGRHTASAACRRHASAVAGASARPAADQGRPTVVRSIFRSAAPMP